MICFWSPSLSSLGYLRDFPCNTPWGSGPQALLDLIAVLSGACCLLVEDARERLNSNCPMLFPEVTRHVLYSPLSRINYISLPNCSEAGKSEVKDGLFDDDHSFCCWEWTNSKSCKTLTKYIKANSINKE